MVEGGRKVEMRRNAIGPGGVRLVICLGPGASTVSDNSIDSKQQSAESSFIALFTHSNKVSEKHFVCLLDSDPFPVIIHLFCTR